MRNLPSRRIEKSKTNECDEGRRTLPAERCPVMNLKEKERTKQHEFQGIKVQFENRLRRNERNKLKMRFTVSTTMLWLNRNKKRTKDNAEYLKNFEKLKTMFRLSNRFLIYI